MTDKLLDTVLLFALPASGKSEVRSYLASLTPEQCRGEFHMGPTLQLDDYPYVHLMHRIDDELTAAGWHDCYYKGPARPFQDEWEWAALVELLNEDFADLMHGRVVRTDSAAEQLFDRFDRAHAKVGLPEHLGDVPHRLRRRVAQKLEAECAKELEARNRTCSQNPKGHTIIIEAARGGPNGAAFPLTPPLGYESTFQQLAPAILERASILYIWVDPAESRRKNIERGRPDGQGSILHHSVPMEVMVGQYGCDDMGYLLEQSDRANTVKVERLVEEAKPSGERGYRSQVFHLPAARFDNRKDKTTFVRKPRAEWVPSEIRPLHDGLAQAFKQLIAAQR